MSEPPKAPGRVPLITLLRHPGDLLAYGFGSGLSPWAPGTVGTLVAVPLYLLMASLPLAVYSILVVAAALLGIWLCGAASARTGRHDDPGIVWDEFVGLWIALWAVPPSWPWVVTGFLVFRVFDIAKPWPISVLDRKVGGGLGIMLDDLLAGVLACVTLHLALWLSP